MKDCLTDQTILQLLSGELSDDDAILAFEHAEKCPSCESRIDQLESTAKTPWLGAMRLVGQSKRFEDEPEAIQAIRLSQMPVWLTTSGDVRDDDTHPDAERAATVPLEIRDYRLIEQIGSGGMGTVYKAWHTKLDKPVAIKFLNDHEDHSPEALARFDREMKAIGGLDHPNIVRALDAGEAAGTRFLVMEFVDGQTLSELVHNDGPLTAEHACDLVRQAAFGLEHIHRRGLVHRDIKPSNLICEVPDDDKFQSGRVKILDLGIALISQEIEENSSGSLTSKEQVMGTYDFLAPEQALGSHEVDIRVDIYALGCTLYFLLTGKAPFAEQRPVEKLVSHQLHSPRSLSEFRDDLSPSLISIVNKMMAKSPEMRFQSPSEVVNALGNLNSGQAVIQKPRTIGLAVMGVMIAVLVGGVATLVHITKPTANLTNAAAVASNSADAEPMATATPGSSDLREVARRLLSLGAKVSIRLPEQSVRENVRRIPDGEFALKGIECVDLELTDQIMQGLGSADELKHVVIENNGTPTQLSDEGISQFLEKGFPLLEYFTVVNQPFNDDHLASLVASSPKLVSVHIVGGDVTDSGISKLADSPKLTRVSLEDLSVDGSGLNDITADIQTLGIRNLRLKESAILQLPDWPNLSAISMDQSTISDRALQSFGKYKRIHTIRAGGVLNPTAAGWDFLKALKELEHLTLKENKTISNDVLSNLTEHKSLRHLGLDRTKISDDGLQHLKSLASLKRLNLRGNQQLSRSALAALREALPECQISDVHSPNDLEVARWIISVGGTFQANSTQSVSISSIDQIPSDAFSIVSVDLRATTVVESDLNQLAQLPKLVRLYLGYYDGTTELGPTTVSVIARAGFPRLAHLHLYSIPLQNLGLAEVGKLQNLVELTLYDCNIADDQIKNVSRLSNLRYFDLSHNKISGRGLNYLAESELQTLMLIECPLAIEAFIDLPAWRNLWLLRIDGCPLNDAAIHSISKYPKLRDLGANMLRDVTPEGWNVLESLPNLERLRLVNNRRSINDSVIPKIAKLKQLYDLDLGGAAITDAGLRKLGVLKKLKRLAVHNNGRISPAALKEVKEVLPNCSVYHH